MIKIRMSRRGFRAASFITWLQGTGIPVAAETLGPGKARLCEYLIRTGNPYVSKYVVFGRVLYSAYKVPWLAGFEAKAGL